MRLGQTVKVVADMVGRGGTATSIDRGTVFPHAEQHDAGLLPVGESSLGSIGLDAVAQHRTELLAAVSHHGGIDRLKVMTQFHVYERIYT